MKITSQEEYGLRILIRIASCRDKDGMSIPQLSESEGLTSHYVAKMARILRLSGFIRSTPGNKGGYMLAKPADEIIIKDVLESLGGIMFDQSFCGTHSGGTFGRFCNNSVDCSARSLWGMVQNAIDQVLEKITLQNLISTQTFTSQKLGELFNQLPVNG